MRRFARCFTNRLDPRFVEHRVGTLVSQRVFGLSARLRGSRDELRNDPVFAILAGKLEPVMGTARLLRARARSIDLSMPKRHDAKYHKIECSTEEVDALLFED
jgi:hypothetical protein